MMGLGWEVRVLDDLSAGSLDNIKRWLDHERFEFIKGDMRDPGIVEEAFDGVEVVFTSRRTPKSGSAPRALNSFTRPTC